MGPVHIPPRLVHETFGRLRGLRALLGSLHTGLLEAAWHEEEELQRRAETGDLEYSDLQVETQLKDERFQFWVPRFAGYSAITLVHSLVETQLFECVAAVRTKVGRPSPVPKRRGIDRARNQLRMVTDFDVSKDLAWSSLLDLENIRNFLVHSGGVPTDEAQTRWLARLADDYKGKLWMSDGLYWYNRHLVVTLRLGAQFVETADGFFRRVFPMCGLSVEGVRLVK